MSEQQSYRVLKRLASGGMAEVFVAESASILRGVEMDGSRLSLPEREALIHDRSERIDQITLSFLSHLAILIIWLLLLTCYAHVVPPLNRLGTALLTGVSLMSVIAGFAAQATLGNLVSGISLVLYKPFRLGDRLQVQSPAGPEIGEVQDISLGYTVLKTEDGRSIIVANGTMAQQTMIKLPPATQGNKV